MLNRNVPAALKDALAPSIHFLSLVAPCT